MKKFSIRKYSKSIIALVLALVMSIGLAGYLSIGNASASAKEPTIVKTPAVSLLHPYDKLTENPSYEEDEKFYEDGYHSEYRKEFESIYDKIDSTSKTAVSDMDTAFFEYLEDTLTGTPYRKIMFYRVHGRIILHPDKLNAAYINGIFEDRLSQYAKQHCELWSSAWDYYLNTGDYYFEDLLHFYLDIWTVDYQTVGNLTRNNGWRNMYAKACGYSLTDDPMYPIKDVQYGGWYWKPLVWALNEDVTTGTEAQKFSPDRTCTNAEAITFLWRAVASVNRPMNYVDATQGLATNVGWDLPFDNVQLSDYYFFPSKWAYDQGMIPGGTFDISSACTRAMIVKYIWQAHGSPDVDTDAQFTDVPADADYAKAVAWAVETGITTGTTATTFSPDTPCTRAQIVTFLYRAYASDEFKNYEFLDQIGPPEPYIQDGREPITMDIPGWH